MKRAKATAGHKAGERDGRAGVYAGLARFEYLQRWTFFFFMYRGNQADAMEDQDRLFEQR